MIRVTGLSEHQVATAERVGLRAAAGKTYVDIIAVNAKDALDTVLAIQLTSPLEQSQRASLDAIASKLRAAVDKERTEFVRLVD